MSISKNLAHLHEQITEACRRSNRPESEVALMAVSKVHPVEAILEAYAAGQRLFGENRVQEFQEKSPRLKDLTAGQAVIAGIRCQADYEHHVEQACPEGVHDR